MIRRPPRSTQSRSSAASDVYKRQTLDSENYNILEHFESCYNFIDEGLKYTNVLVHCAAGVSRSPTIVIMYLVKKQNMTVGEAFSFVQAKRSCIQPNKGFLEQLQKFEKLVRQQQQQPTGENQNNANNDGIVGQPGGDNRITNLVTN
eukprot:TRINITY_DN2697_c0_g1_i10.p2 TRINITY_DN2697_c0_g1~~TRINITY_DN2697_c0_g1_i10.p2  ORF type:complete len:147 (-),score=43.27 TRINITY_DN2697_c0_g1_i10:135-575(-)